MAEKNILKNEKFLMIIIFILIVLFAILLLFPNITNPLKNIINREKVYSIEIIKISGCEDCFNLDSILSSLDEIDNIKIKNEREIDYNSAEGKKLISKYNLQTIPTLIIESNQIDKIQLDNTLFRKSGKAAIFDKSVPYIDLDSGEIVGLVNLTGIYDPSCSECVDLTNTKKQLEAFGIKINNYETIDISSEKGKELAVKNKINYVPTLLISKDIEKYWWLYDGLKTYLIEYDDNYHLSLPTFPYKEISTGTIKGKVKVTYITNKSCEDCFNVTQLKAIFERNGVYIESEKYFDINAGGRELIYVYNISAIPTAVFSKEISDYVFLRDGLEKIGTFEKDGSFVVRNLDLLNVKYQDIKK